MNDNVDTRSGEETVKRQESVEAELLRRNQELTELNVKLSRAQEQLLQSEKLASIGQLAAGVAHEINNPISFVFSNFGTCRRMSPTCCVCLSSTSGPSSSSRSRTWSGRLRRCASRWTSIS
jgi:signal transduction histidine kinase